MRYRLVILSFFVFTAVAAQKDSLLEQRSLSFHQALVRNDSQLANYLDEELSYGHSNGWIETKTVMINNLETGYIKYHSIKEDSMQVTINGNMAHARFVGDYNVTLNENTNTFHLKVLEVWVKKGKRWLLFARQAVK